MKSLNKFIMGGLCLSSALALTACVSDSDSDSNETASSSAEVTSASSVVEEKTGIETAYSGDSGSTLSSSSNAASSSSSKTAKSSSSVAAIPLADFDSLFLAETNGIDCAEGDTLIGSDEYGIVYRCQKDSTGNVGWQRPYLDYTATPCSNMETWVAAEDGSRIETGCNTGLENSGYWFEYDDSKDGGASYITWPVAKGEGIDPLGAIIDSIYDLSGTYTLASGALTYNPFIGLGFWLGGTDSNGTPALVDVSSWESVCITYSSDAEVYLKMDLGDYMNATIGFDNPKASLPKARNTIATKTFTWDKFKQAGWGVDNGGKIIRGEQAAKMLAGFKFEIQGNSGSTGNFTIYSIGINGCNSGLSL